MNIQVSSSIAYPEHGLLFILVDEQDLLAEPGWFSQSFVYLIISVLPAPSFSSRQPQLPVEV